MLGKKSSFITQDFVNTLMNKLIADRKFRYYKTVLIFTLFISVCGFSRLTLGEIEAPTYFYLRNLKNQIVCFLKDGKLLLFISKQWTSS